MKRILALVACLGIAAFSTAQLNFDDTSDLQLRLGYVFPFDDDTRNVTGDLLGVGADYFLPGTLIPGANGESYVSLDWLAKSASGAKGNMFPIMINQRWYGGDVSPYTYGQRSYYFVGLGIAVIDIVTTDTVLAGRIGAGMEFGEHLFGEATFVISGEGNGGASATSGGLYIGYRF